VSNINSFVTSAVSIIDKAFSIKYNLKPTKALGGSVFPPLLIGGFCVVQTLQLPLSTVLLQTLLLFHVGFVALGDNNVEETGGSGECHVEKVILLYPMLTATTTFKSTRSPALNRSG
jgi:hypothetical protein